MSTPRVCGGCVACCKTHAVVEIRKLDGVWCPHVNATRTGCSVYTTRPMSCATFKCAWLKGSGGENERPDKVRVVCTTETIEYRGRKINWCTIIEVSHGALKSAYGIARTKQLRDDGWVVEHFNIGSTSQTIFLPIGLQKSDLPHLLELLKTDDALSNTATS